MLATCAFSSLSTADTCLWCPSLTAGAHLNIPDGAGGVNAAGPQTLGVSVIPVKGSQRCTVVTVLVLHQQTATQARRWSCS